MPDVFATVAGSVYEFKPGGGALPFTAAVGAGLTFDRVRGVVTAVGLSQQGNFQFLHTLRNFVYVYVFGERIADLTLSGVMFLNPCQGGAAAAAAGGAAAALAGGDTGWKRVYDFYNQYRISKNPTPVVVTVGGVTVEAFLVGMNMQAQDPANMLGQFSMSLKYLPDQGN